MHIFYDEDEYETVSHSRPCTACGGDLGKCRGVGCNGSSGFGTRRRSPEEIAKIKAEKQRKREDEILAEAELIRIRRSLFPTGNQ
ncbi:hypothetical protein ABIF26_006497 [Bradyrhizobium elkanii]|uniref:hypothetical protein n=1 Tax=Bradyrhizobium elkanii TaxID=29448 RepID=UPI0035146CB4